MTNVTRRMRSVERRVIRCRMQQEKPCCDRNSLSQQGFFCMGIEFIRRDTPPKPLWRVKMSKGNARFPTKTHLAAALSGPGSGGAFPRQIGFGGLSLVALGHFAPPKGFWRVISCCPWTFCPAKRVLAGNLCA